MTLLPPPAADDLDPLAGHRNRVHLQDCIVGMQTIPDASIDMILCDLPYGTTQCKWDAIIPYAPLWEAYTRIIKPHGAIVLTAAMPFTATLVVSNLPMYRYSWVWEKSKATGYLNAKKRPLVAHEDVLVFSKKTPRYFPQKTQGLPYNKGKALRPTDVYGSQRETLVQNTDGTRYPRSVQYFKTAESEGKVHHPTQKPVGVFAYLVQTYTLPGEVVLDSCMGSGTTALACLQTGRDFVGFETDPKFLAIANARIQAALGTTTPHPHP